MKRPFCAVAICLTAAGCIDGSRDDSDTITVSEEALSDGQNQGQFLTFLTFSEPDEHARQLDTCNGTPPNCGTTNSSYYSTVGVTATGSNNFGNLTIAKRLPRLSDFISFYNFSSEVKTFYYNRGDLGLGREMHCVDHLAASDGQIACYVSNFAANTALDEFAFGLSSNVAFANLDADSSFATVAMVFRSLMPIDAPNRVFFVVYDGNGNLQPFAALDRHGITYANALKSGTPGPEFGTPGVSFNNHVPSNCISCHGGKAYDKTGHAVTAALFLPFDLDQFDYEAVSTKTRGDQLTAFKHQNEVVRKVAALSVSSANKAGTSVKNQLDTWYHNTNHVGQNDRNEVFENDFDSTAVVSGWSGAPDIYQSVIRPTCRNCHMSNQTTTPGTPVKPHTFDLQTDFNSFAPAAVSFLCGHQMPHSLQTLRQFWQSTRPAALASYLDGVDGNLANTLRGCGPGDVATLDPPEIMAALTAARQ